MTLLEAIVLGLIQGATEFLPISSSGHLKLGQTLLGIDEPQLLFDIVLHVGTLISVVIFYRRELAMIVSGMLEGARAGLERRSLEAALEPEGMRLAWLIVVATVPTGLLGVGLDRVLDPETGPSLIGPRVVCGLLLVNGLVLLSNRWLVRRPPTPEREGLMTAWNLDPLRAVLVGLAQGLAVLPGISRSGTTITAALALGVERHNAARYAFLLFIPAIAGAVVLKFDLAAFEAAGGLAIYALGACVAGLTGYVCLLVLTRMLERAQFHHFAWYCWIVGGLGLALL